MMRTSSDMLCGSNHRLAKAFLALVVIVLSAVVTPAQTAAIHRMERAHPNEDGSVTVTLSGNASSSLGRHFDLFPVEFSHDLAAWFPLRTLTRTNASVDVVEFADAPSEEGRRFYRTPTNILATPLPPLTGPYAAGTFSSLFTDISRTNVARHAPHQFMVTFWYPAAPSAGVLPGPYVDAKLLPSLNSFYGFNVNAAFVGHAISEAALATNQASWPVVLYSPSANSHRRENVYKVEELASHGFVVVGMNHRDTFGSVFPDGKVVTGQAVDGTSLSSILRPSRIGWLTLVWCWRNLRA